MLSNRALFVTGVRKMLKNLRQQITCAYNKLQLNKLVKDDNLVSKIDKWAEDLVAEHEAMVMALDPDDESNQPEM